MVRQASLQEGPRQVDKRGAKQPLQAGRELKRPNVPPKAGSLALGNPDQEILCWAQDRPKRHVANLRRVVCLPDQVSDEAGADMIDLIKAAAPTLVRWA